MIGNGSRCSHRFLNTLAEFRLWLERLRADSSNTCPFPLDSFLHHFLSAREYWPGFDLTASLANTASGSG
jgi:hypothetical protein